jgi:REP element-mobilizing transposase RayT
LAARRGPHLRHLSSVGLVTQGGVESLARCTRYFLATHPSPWDEATEDLYHTQFSGRLDEYLDAGHGCCALRESKISKIVADRFHHFNGQRYQLWSFVIMPNHAHVLFSVHDGEHLPDILKGWKGVSSNHIHKAGLSDLNPFWQPEYFDRLIRGPEHFATVRAYIHDNPVKASLKRVRIFSGSTTDKDRRGSFNGARTLLSASFRGFAAKMFVAGRSARAPFHQPELWRSHC